MSSERERSDDKVPLTPIQEEQAEDAKADPSQTGASLYDDQRGKPYGAGAEPGDMNKGQMRESYGGSTRRQGFGDSAFGGNFGESVGERKDR